LENFNLSPLSPSELIKTNGGGPPGWIVAQIYTEASAFWKDFMQGYEYCSCKLNNPPQ
jgi:hypothetical protein